MKICPKCGAQLDDEAIVCTNCGLSMNNAPAAQVPMVKETDHTAEFDAQDIADNRLYAVIAYATGLCCMSPVGIIIALLAAKDSKFVMFHVKENVKLFICEAIVAAAAIFLSWLIFPIMFVVVIYLMLYVVRIIAMVNAWSGKAKEVPLLSGLKFFN